MTAFCMNLISLEVGRLTDASHCYENLNGPFYVWYVNKMKKTYCIYLGL